MCKWYMDVWCVFSIEMLGDKSETHWHQVKLDEFMENENVNSLHRDLTELGTYLDEIEGIQSTMENSNDEHFVLSLLCQSRFSYYHWINGMLLAALMVIQIRTIRKWFNHFAINTSVSATDQSKNQISRRNIIFSNYQA
ncbi:hypothetical protein RFI_11313 [Reticulomyxa filosa]|uniref:Uncharacterized protein n=1 Tax=Reticulomyxa filosa TaxID=46433 RepID=X6NKD9_RETFI|nr:hypothetical protein RFI_11313 [Reticulomyxa filosa]|eukprot:ETO25827.1 hypothetical protein RFI_11313 [Reticulomyxa filosa]